VSGRTAVEEDDMIRLVAALLVITMSSTAWAVPCIKQVYSDPKKEPDYKCPSPGEDALVPRLELKTSVELVPSKKPKIPWPGILMDKNRVLTLGMRITALRRLRWMDMVRAGELRENDRKYDAAQFTATINLRTAQRDNYKGQTKELQEKVISLNKWYRSPALWFAVGFVVAAGGATALAVGLRE
jgi:hypothetical protein